MTTNIVFKGDCNEYLRTMPDKSVDIVITDPPYGMEYHSGYYKNGNPHTKIVGDDRYPSEIIHILKRKARKAVFCFCRWDNLAEVEKPDSFIVWAKNNWSAGNLHREFARMWEGILFYALDDFAFNTRLPDVIDSRRVPPTELQHPTQKPLSVITALIDACSQPNDIIFDPFMGSGTTCVAAKKLGRKYIGIELEEKYVEIAKQRLAQGTLPFYE